MSARGPRYFAQQKGKKKYMSEIPCKKGHIGLRVTATGTCIECRRIKQRAKYYADPVKTKALVKQKYQNNAEKLRAKHKEWYYKNIEQARADAIIRSAEWRKLNPNHAGTKLSKVKWKQNNNGLVMAHTAKRRAAKLQRTPTWLTKIDYERISNEYKLASLLTKVTGSPWHVDHIIPLQGKIVSGLHVPSNLRAIPEIQNVTKANIYISA